MEGNYGKIDFIKRGRKYYAKKSNKDGLTNYSEIEKIKLLQSTGKVCKIFKLESSKGQLMMVMEKEDQSLREMIDNGTIKTYDRLIKLLFGIVESLYVIHKYNIIHRDIKPSNVLVTNDKIRICDFGISTYDLGITPTSEMNMSTPSAIDYRDKYFSSQKLYGKEIDIWSLGIIAKEMSKNIKVTNVFRDFIKCTLRPPKKRYTALQCLEHEIFKKLQRTKFMKCFHYRYRMNILARKVLKNISLPNRNKLVIIHSLLLFERIFDKFHKYNHEELFHHCIVICDMCFFCDFESHPSNDHSLKNNIIRNEIFKYVDYRIYRPTIYETKDKKSFKECLNLFFDNKNIIV